MTRSRRHSEYVITWDDVSTCSDDIDAHGDDISICSDNVCTRSDNHSTDSEDVSSHYDDIYTLHSLGNDVFSSLQEWHSSKQWWRYNLEEKRNTVSPLSSDRYLRTDTQYEHWLQQCRAHKTLPPFQKFSDYFRKNILFLFLSYIPVSIFSYYLWYWNSPVCTGYWVSSSWNTSTALEHSQCTAHIPEFEVGFTEVK